MLLLPSADYRFAFKRGMRGTDVAALQLNFPSLDADGVFGNLTDKVVRAFQNAHSLKVDGIAGLATQRVLVVERSAAAEKAADLPAGMLPSIALNESGFAVAAYSRHPSDAGFDLGAFQRSFPPDSGAQAGYRDAYTVSATAQETAQRMRKVRDELLGRVAIQASNSYATAFPGDGFDAERFCWQLAVLAHNWPAAADSIARRGSISNAPADDDEERGWIVQASAGRLRTPREWAISYVERATVLVHW